MNEWNRDPAITDKMIEDVARAMHPEIADENIQWRPIETAPKDTTEVIVLVRSKVIRLGWYFAPSSRSQGWRDENGREIKLTHWIPMPSLQNE